MICSRTPSIPRVFSASVLLMLVAACGQGGDARAPDSAVVVDSGARDAVDAMQRRRDSLAAVQRRLDSLGIRIPAESLWGEGALPPAPAQDALATLVVDACAVFPDSVVARAIGEGDFHPGSNEGMLVRRSGDDLPITGCQWVQGEGLRRDLALELTAESYASTASATARLAARVQQGAGWSFTPAANVGDDAFFAARADSARLARSLVWRRGRVVYTLRLSRDSLVAADADAGLKQLASSRFATR